MCTVSKILFTAFYPHMTPYSCCRDDQDMMKGHDDRNFQMDVTLGWWAEYRYEYDFRLQFLSTWRWSTLHLMYINFWCIDISFVEPLCYNECGIVTDLVSLATIYWTNIYMDYCIHLLEHLFPQTLMYHDISCWHLQFWYSTKWLRMFLALCTCTSS